MKRRAVVVAGVALVALAAGGGAAFWRARRTHVDTAGAAVDGGGSASDDALWKLTFDRPAGGRLALADHRGTPLLLNFWATWCPPCVKEMPMLDAYARAHAVAGASVAQARGLHIVGLAVDSPTPVREYLQKLPMAFPIGLAGLDGVDLSRSLGNDNGGLPFSVVFDQSGMAVHRKLGALSKADLAAWEREFG